MTDAVRYPATYRAPALRIAAVVVAAAVAIILALLGRSHSNASLPNIAWMVAFLCFTSAVAFRLSEASSRITLYENRIEKKSWFGTKVWQRDDVATIRPSIFGGFRLVRKNNKGDYLAVPAGIKRDAAWGDWLRDTPIAGGR